MRDIFEDLEQPDPADPVRRARELSRGDLPKRFYKDVTVAKEEGDFAIHLDGRPVRTPARAPMRVPSRGVAEALAAEWSGQGDRIDPATMPLTRLVNTALDGVANEREATANDIAKFAGSDLLCYRAEGPERLVDRQTGSWDPIVAWAEKRLGVRFHLAASVMPVDQDPAAVPALRAALPDAVLPLAALHTITTLTGSALLALALYDRHLTPDEAWNAAHIDEDWEIELWGEDAEAVARRAFRRSEFDTAVKLLDG